VREGRLRGPYSRDGSQIERNVIKDSELLLMAVCLSNCKSLLINDKRVELWRGEGEEGNLLRTCSVGSKPALARAKASFCRPSLSTSDKEEFPRAATSLFTNSAEYFTLHE